MYAEQPVANESASSHCQYYFLFETTKLLFCISFIKYDQFTAVHKCAPWLSWVFNVNVTPNMQAKWCIIGEYLVLLRYCFLLRYCSIVPTYSTVTPTPYRIFNLFLAKSISRYGQYYYSNKYYLFFIQSNKAVAKLSEWLCILSVCRTASLSLRQLPRAKNRIFVLGKKSGKKHCTFCTYLNRDISKEFKPQHFPFVSLFNCIHFFLPLIDYDRHAIVRKKR